MILFKELSLGCLSGSNVISLNSHIHFGSLSLIQTMLVIGVENQKPSSRRTVFLWVVLSVQGAESMRVFLETDIVGNRCIILYGVPWSSLCTTTSPVRVAQAATSKRSGWMNCWNMVFALQMKCYWYLRAWFFGLTCTPQRTIWGSWLWWWEST